MGNKFEESLKTAVAKYGTKNWKKVAEGLDLNPARCQAYWRQYLDRRLVEKRENVKASQSPKAKLLGAIPKPKSIDFRRGFRHPISPLAISNEKDREIVRKHIKIEKPKTEVVPLRSWVVKILDGLNDDHPDVVVFVRELNRLQDLVKKCEETTNRQEATVLGSYQRQLRRKVEKFFGEAVVEYFNVKNMSIDESGVEKLITCFFRLNKLKRIGCDI